jgi:pimeloyl-ACP methyl ester carboxylesterase
MIVSDKARRPMLFVDPDGAAAKRFFEVPSDPEARVDTLSQMVWSQACTGKFVWPIADRGFSRRAHRIAAPALIVWGHDDRVIAAQYAHEFATRIADARVELIDKAGHLPHLEQPDAVMKFVRGFLCG